MKTTNWRGAGVPHTIGIDGVKSLFMKGVNLVRYQIQTNPADIVLTDPQAYITWVTVALNNLDTLLQLANHHKRFVIDLHTPPAGFDVHGKARMFNDLPWGFTCMLDTWRMIANRYKGNKYVHVYDLCNECAGTMADTAVLMDDLIETIRAVDEKKRLSITSAYGNPGGFKNVHYYPDDKNIWYTCHQYRPMHFTHQGVGGRGYPIANVTSKSKLKEYLRDVINFKLKHDVNIYIGEFSVSTFAPLPDRLKYLTDCIDVFEEYGFNWSYHAWQEAECWDPTNPHEVIDMLKERWGQNSI